MADLLVNAIIIVAAFAAVLVPFVVLPELLERAGYNPRSVSARGIVWVSFLVIVLVPAIATGFLFSVRNPVDWLLFVVFLIVAILYDYYRLNPDRIPWARRRT